MLGRMNRQMIGEQESMLTTDCSLRVESLLGWRPLWAGTSGGQDGYHRLSTLIADANAVPWYMKIEPLLSAVKAEDGYTARHSRRVAEMAQMIGNELGLSAAELGYLRWGSLLHDIGKIAVDPVVKNKPGKLTPEEYQYMKLHAHVGAGMVRPVIGDKVARMIEHHHDHYDGNGHNGVVGEEIPLGARIIAVADAFDAMVFDRPYRHARTQIEAGDEIEQCANSQFDPKVVRGFINVLRQTLPIGVGII